MILEVVVALSALGFVLFGLGYTLDRPELAIFGALFIIGVGAAGMADGYQVDAGKDTVVYESTSEHASDNISNASLQQALDISGTEPAPTGVTLDPDGSLMYLPGSGEVHQFDSGKYDLSVAQFDKSLDVSTEDGSPQSVVFSPNMMRMYVAGGASSSIYQYNLTSKGDVVTAVLNRSLDLSGNISTPTALALKPDGSRMLVGSEDDVVRELRFDETWNVTSGEIVRELDVSSRVTTLSAMALGPDGKTMLLAGENTDYVYQYGFNSEYAVDSVYYTGNRLNVTNTAPSPSGLSYEEDRRSFFISSEDGTISKFDSSLVRTETVEETREVYQDIEVHSGFPVDIVVLLLGAVMLMSSAGKASEADVRTERQRKPPWERGGDN